MKIKHKFAVLKNNGWGILINIGGSFKKNDLLDFSLHLMKVNSHFYIRTLKATRNNYVQNNSDIILSDVEKEYIMKGIDWFTSQINPSLLGQYFFSLEIEIEIPSLCDYKAEGLFFAVAEWLAIALNQELPKYEICIKKGGKNAYVFPMIEQYVDNIPSDYEKYQMEYNKEENKHIYTPKYT